MAGNEGSKATIVAHSMGALATTFWLSRKGDAWVDQHIAAFISVSAPWQGSPTALKGLPQDPPPPPRGSPQALLSSPRFALASFMSFSDQHQSSAASSGFFGQSHRGIVKSTALEPFSALQKQDTPPPPPSPYSFIVCLHSSGRPDLCDSLKEALASQVSGLIDFRRHLQMLGL